MGQLVRVSIPRRAPAVVGPRLDLDSFATRPSWQRLSPAALAGPPPLLCRRLAGHGRADPGAALPGCARTAPRWQPLSPAVLAVAPSSAEVRALARLASPRCGDWAPRFAEVRGPARLASP